MRKSMTAACTATTAAGTNTAKTTAIVNGIVNTVLDVMSKMGALTPQQQQAVAALKAECLTDVATIRIAIYGA